MSILPAFRFLTILPLPGEREPLRERDLSRSAAAFVLVGLSQGLLLVVVELTAAWIFSPGLALWLTLLALVLISGGFHLDGLADTFDALAVKSSGDLKKDRLRRLAAMKDPATGTMGMLAVFFTLLLKFFALQALAQSSWIVYYSSLLLMPALGKWAMVMSMHRAIPARLEGLGRLFVGTIGYRELIWAGLSLAGPLLLLCLLAGRPLVGHYFLFYLLLMPLAIYFFSRAMIILFQQRFGGLSGDTLGAINELAEVVFLLLVLLWLRLSAC